MLFLPRFLTVVLAGWLLLLLRLQGDPGVDPVSGPPSPDAVAAGQRLRVAPGLKVSLWAGEPLVRDVTSVSFDAQGRAYVVESGRRRTSVFDVRNLGPWLDDDFSFRTVGDRTAFLRRVLDPIDPQYAKFVQSVTKSGFRDFNGDGQIDWRDLNVESERLRLVWPASGAGPADRARTFADGFATSVSGVAAGVLAEGTNVWFTCIPDLWKFPAADSQALTGTNAAAVANREAGRVLSGFGVHIAFGGHDLHGLIKGPDGRIYFTIADRGTCVTNREGKVISLPDSGAVFRCEPDGANFEIFAHGLRNPQELAFDALGNLWTADNNGDGGDKARWTLVLEGADYGWTIGWQWLPKMGAWNSERLWHTKESNSAAYIMPPVAHIGHGPAGIAYYPGTGLGDRFADHFFYADFPGGVRTFRLEPDGAFFKVAPAAAGELSAGRWMEDNSTTNFTGKLLWDLSPVDVTFPPFGGVIVADWVRGWEKTGQGRLWHVTDPKLAQDPAIAEVRRLLGDGMARRGERELGRLLGHRDQRVRLEAQWELARRGKNGWREMERIALRKSDGRLARLHSLWGLGQIARASAMTEWLPELDRMQTLLDDADEEVRGWAARFFSEARFTNAGRRMRPMLKDPSPRVRAQVLMAYAGYYPDKLPFPDRLERRSWRTRETAILQSYQQLPKTVAKWVSRPESQGWVSIDFMLDALDSLSRTSDPALRYAMLFAMKSWPSMALNSGSVGRLFRHANPDVRAAIAIIVRGSSRFLHVEYLDATLADTDSQVVLETARAIHDPERDWSVNSQAIVPHLANLLNGEQLGRLQHREGLPFTLAEARTWILRRSLNANFRLGDATNAAAIATFAANTAAPESVRVEALEDLADWANPPARDRVVGRHRPIPPRPPAAARNALNAVWSSLIAADSPSAIVVAALQAGERLGLDGLPDALNALATRTEESVRKEVTRIRDSARLWSLPELAAGMERGSVKERRTGFARAGTSTNPAVAPLLTEWVARMTAGKVERELQADVVDAARAIPPTPSLLQQLAAWTASLPKDDPLAPYRSALAGGDATNGRKLFAERADWGCQRCHKLRGDGGEVGPELGGLGKTKGAESVLRSIQLPNAEIAPGFENVVVTKRDGSVVSGVLKAEGPTTVELLSPEDGRVVIPKTEVASRERGMSAMPDGLIDLMTLRELRDLIAALTE